MNVNREELAWAAGFFDGEGCTSTHTKKNGIWKTLRMSLAQVESEPFDRFLNAIGGLGTTHIRLDKNPNHQIQNRWQACNQEALQVMELLRPYLSGPKIRQFDSCVAYAQTSPGWGYPQGRYPRVLQTECRHGHDWTNPANVYVRPDGHRNCKVCRNGR